MKVEDLISGISTMSDDQLLSLIHDIRKDRTTRKAKPAVKKVHKDAFAELLKLAEGLSPDELSLLKGALQGDKNGEES